MHKDDRGPELDSVTEFEYPHSGFGHEAILLVDDNEPVRNAIASVLQLGGYKVLLAESAEKAIETCRHYSDPIDLLITDVVLPRANGVELAVSLVSQHPEMKVLFMSGYTEETVHVNGILGPGMPFLQKPVSMDAFSHKVRSVLEHPLDRKINY